MSPERNHPDYLKRLQKDAYQGIAYVHWTHTIANRQTGWLNSDFHARFREALTHAAFTYDLDVPCYCLMPDHFHILMIGNNPVGSDQKNANRWFRKRVNWILADIRSNLQLQVQSYDNVLREKDRERNAFANICDYVRNNPRRAGLIDREAEGVEWEFQGCVTPGCPELKWSDAENEYFWNLFWKWHYQKIEKNAQSM